MLQYIRLADNTKPELTLELMIRQWKLKKPDIVISIQGGLKNFQLDPHHKEIFNRGLIKAAKTTNNGAWIITGKTGCFRRMLWLPYYGEFLQGSVAHPGHTQADVVVVYNDL